MVLINKIGLILFHFAWQATVIALLAGMMLFVFKNAGSKVRYAICCLSMLLMVALPIIFALDNLSNAPSNFEGSPLKGLTPVDTKEEFYDGNLIGITYRTGQIHISSYEELMYYVNRYTPWISISWMLGVLLTIVYRIYGFSKVRSLVRQSRCIAESSWETKIRQMMRNIGIHRAVVILQSSSIDTPAVIGFVKPILLLPVSFLTGFEYVYVEAILLHELAHIKRFDYLVNGIQLIVETFGFFHPAVWWISNRIRRERENCCDDIAVEISGDRLTYVKSLVRLEELRQYPSLLTAANGPGLSDRITRLLSGKSRFQNSQLFNFVGPSVLMIFLFASLGLVMTGAGDAGMLNDLLSNGARSSLKDNLIAYFPFNGDANDESTYRQKTSVHNAVLCEDRFGQKDRAFDFNGKDSYIFSEKKNVLNSARSVTVSCWIYPRSAGRWQSWICKDGPKWGSEWRIGFGENNNDEWGLTTCNPISGRNNWANYWITNTGIPLQKWTHVTVSADQDSNIVTAYMNGKRIGALKDLRRFEKSESPFRIGFQTDDNVYFDGKLDDIRIYNRVLSDEEVREVQDMD